ncbi:hypothetical protein D3C87_650900 [compost metagenome]
MDINSCKMTRSQIEEAEISIWNLEAYRSELGYQNQVPHPSFKQKIQCRLFYEGDDLPGNLWQLSVPQDPHAEILWACHLLSNQHNARVGIVDDYSRTNDDHKVSVIFEDPNDLLIFKLTLPTL